MKHKILIVAALIASTSSAHAIERTIDFEATEFKYTDEADINGDPLNVNISNQLTTFTTGDLTISGIGRTSTPGTFRFASSPITSPDYSGYALMNNTSPGSIGFKFSFDDAVNSLSMNLGIRYKNDWLLQAFDDSGTQIDSLNISGLPAYGNNGGARFGLSSELYNISYATLTNQGEAFFGGVYEDQMFVDNFTYNTAAPVPEPSTYALMLGGLGMVGFMAYRRRKTATI